MSSSTSTKIKRKRSAPDKKSKEKQKYDEWAANFIQSDVFVATIKAAVHEAVQMALSEVKQSCSVIKEKVDELEEEMKSSNEKIVRIEKELAAQYEVLRKIRTGGNEGGSRGMENKDYAEEKERNRSVVILHVAEGQSRFALENNMEDLKKVNEILKHIDGGTSPVAVYRLGRPREDNKCRLLKVVMPSSSSQRDILFKAHRLRSLVNAPNPPIYIRRSMSPEELKEYREKRAEKRQKAQTTVNMSNIDVEMTPSDVQPVLTPKN
ncbi:hypothetical protein CAEBREN_09017 [Caenorhabditis brenneri]|uniref:Uncharacterized protein n=1 Tax=Caenorhabditis brenneri TaxID=135651 RepID=G0PFG6_CAEBE|nr:hypothetical protein CAEBREN_09017 [Caenorhabditis brenneri]